MPRKLKSEMLDFLNGLDEWMKADKPAGEYYRRPATVTYRLRRHGLKAVRGVGLVDDRTGEAYAEMRGRGEILTPT